MGKINSRLMNLNVVTHDDENGILVKKVKDLAEGEYFIFNTQTRSFIAQWRDGNKHVFESTKTEADQSWKLFDQLKVLSGNYNN